MIAARREAVGKIVEDAAQAGEALERAQFEKFVEQKRGRPAGSRLRTAEQTDGRIEGNPGAAGRRRGIADRKHRDGTDGAEKTLRRGRGSFDVDVLSDGPS